MRVDSEGSEGGDLRYHAQRGEVAEATDDGGLEQGGVQGGPLLPGAPEPALQSPGPQQQHLHALDNAATQGTLHEDLQSQSVCPSLH
jgi:hypothetical protein